MEQLTQLVTDVNSFIWGLWCLIPLLLQDRTLFHYQAQIAADSEVPGRSKEIFVNKAVRRRHGSLPALAGIIIGGWKSLSATSCHMGGQSDL